MALATQPTSFERRVQSRQPARLPAYASIGRAPKGTLLDLYQVLDLSESGAAIRTPFGMVPGRTVDLCLDLRDAPTPVYASAKVVWSDDAGRVGLSFPVVAHDSMRSLKEWLRLNKNGVMIPEPPANGNGAATSLPRPDQSELLAALPAIQREADACGSDLRGALSLIASRTQALMRATGAAIALAGGDQKSFECYGSAGLAAPPVGARLQVGAGFSGACVSAGKTLRCDDAETDDRVDRESCAALGIRSMLATPVKAGETVVGLIEAFSSQPQFFHENDVTALQRLSDTVLVCVNRARGKEAIAAAAVPAPRAVVPTTGSVLFAPPRERGEEHTALPAEQSIRLPKVYLRLLVVMALTIFSVLGYYSAPWIQQLRSRRVRVHAASPDVPSPKPRPPLPANVDELKSMAEQGDPSAENALGLRYFSGDGVTRNEQLAAHWFLSAADHGNLSAQSMLGSMYWAGRGVPYNVNQAYFWTVLARAGGDEAGKSLAPIIAKRLTRAQAAAIELQAGQWIQQHEAASKPASSPS